MKIEKRTFVDKDKFNELVKYFDDNSNKKETERQIIYFYHTEKDFRIIRTKNYIKMDLKPDNINDKEQTVYVANKYDQSLIDMFYNLGISVDFKRYRIRHKYLYKNYYITLDENIKFGNVLRITININEDSQTIDKMIQDLYDELNIKKSSMDMFNELYSKYRTNWVDLTKNINEEEFLNYKD